MNITNGTGGLPKVLCDALKHARKARGLTQFQMAEKAGLSPAFINQLENGKKTPSLKTLLERICSAYQINNLFALLEQGDLPERPFVMMNKSTKLETFKMGKADQLTYLVLADAKLVDENMFIGYVILEGHADSETTTHPGEEAFCVLEGKVQLTIEGETVVLEPYDVAHYKSDQPHRVCNPEQSPARVLVMRSPAHRS